jgi:hypothetical protein
MTISGFRKQKPAWVFCLLSKLVLLLSKHFKKTESIPKQADWVMLEVPNPVCYDATMEDNQLMSRAEYLAHRNYKAASITYGE